MERPSFTDRVVDTAGRRGEQFEMQNGKIKLIAISRSRELANRIESLLDARSIEVQWVSGFDKLLRLFETDTYDLLVVSGEMLRVDPAVSIEKLELVTDNCPLTRILLLVESDNIGLAEEAMKRWSFQYTKLPVMDRELKLLVETTLDNRPVYGRNRFLKFNGNQHIRNEIIGCSNPIKEIFQQIRQASATDIPVLLEGETGTGKDMVALTIHLQSNRRDREFIPINLGAIPRDLVGSELFGHEKGAFTGALDNREGKFEQGDKGTVFLDEIGSIDEKTQISLLRLIEEKTFYRLGGKKLISTDVRLIAATNENLMELVRQGQFREDLFYRLDVFRIMLPPLRERPGDIHLLIEEFLHRFNRLFQKDIRAIAPECLQILEAYSWPGNVRELKNVIQRGVLVCEGNVLLPRHLPPRFTEACSTSSVVMFEVGTPLSEVEQEMLKRTLASNSNNRKRTAELLGISRRALYNKLRKYCID